MSIFLGLLFGTFGLMVLKQAKKIASFELMWLGIAITALPYFVTNIYWMSGVETALIIWSFSKWNF